MLLALDPSTTAVGWVLFDGNQYHSSGVFKPPSHLGADERIVAIGRWLGYFDWSRIDAIACEVPTGDRGNRKTDRQLGGVFYICMLKAKVQGKAFHRVYPGQVKQTGVSKHDLQAAERYVRDATGNKARKVGPDEADALGVMLAFLRTERRWIE